MTTSVNSKNIVTICNNISDFKAKHSDYSGCYFILTQCGNSSDILVRMSSGVYFQSPFMRLTFTASNYKFRNLILSL